MSFWRSCKPVKLGAWFIVVNPIMYADDCVVFSPISGGLKQLMV